MAVRKHEDYFHSPEQVNGYIEEALVLLNAHELTPDERAHLLPQLVNLLSGKTSPTSNWLPSGCTYQETRGTRCRLTRSPAPREVST